MHNIGGMKNPQPFDDLIEYFPYFPLIDKFVFFLFLFDELFEISVVGKFRDHAA